MALEWYKTNPAQIVEHTVHLRGIADDIRQASTAVEGVTVPTDGYGEAGAQFAKILEGITDEANHTLIAAIVAMEVSASALKKSAEEYDRLENNAAQRLRKAGDRQ
jgi:hypothetical protein